MRLGILILAVVLLWTAVPVTAQADEAQVQAIQGRIANLKQQLNNLYQKKSQLQQLLAEQQAQQTRAATQDKLADAEEIYADPTFADIRDDLDKNRLEYAHEFQDPEDILSLKEKVEGEVPALKKAIEEARNQGDENRADMLQGQLEVKGQVAEGLQQVADVRIFQNKDGQGQEQELADLKTEERLGHMSVVQEEAKLTELEQKVKEADEAWFGLGAPDEELTKQLEEQKKKTAKAKEEFAKTQKEMLVKAGSATEASDEAVQEVFDHAAKRTVAQMNVVAGAEEKTLFRAEDTDKDAAKAIQDKLLKGDPAGALMEGLRANADKGLDTQDVDRKEETLLQMTQALKQGTEARAQSLEKKKQNVLAKHAQGTLTKEQASAQLQEISGTARSNAALTQIAQTIEKSRADNAATEENKNTIFSGTAAAWNDEIHGTKTGALAKTYNVATALVGDGASVLVDTAAGATGGKVVESSTHKANKAMATNNESTAATLRSLQQYSALSAKDKQDIRNHELYGTEIKNDKAKQTYDKLDKQFLSKTGGEGVQMLNAGALPGSPRDQLAVAVAQANRDVEQDIKRAKEILDKEYNTSPVTLNQRSTLNPVTAVTQELTEHERQKSLDFLERKKQEQAIVDVLRDDLREGTEYKEDIKHFLQTTSQGLKAQEQITKDKTHQKVASLNQRIEATPPGAQRDALRVKRDQVQTLGNKKTAAYRDQAAHLRAEDMVAKGDIAGANAIYAQQAQNNPAKAGLYKGLIKTNNEHMVAKKTNELSRDLANSVGTDVLMVVATGGAGKLGVGAKKTATLGAKIKHVAKVYGKALNPIDGPKGMGNQALNRVKAKVIADATGMDENRVFEGMMLLNVGKAHFKSAKIQRALNQPGPKAKFDTAVAQPVRQLKNKIVDNAVAISNKAKGYAKKLKAGGNKPPAKIKTGPGTSTPHVQKLRGKLKMVNGEPVLPLKDVLATQKSTKNTRDVKNAKNAKELQKGFNNTLRKHVYEPHDKKLTEHVGSMPEYKGKEIRIDDFRTPGAGDDSVNTDRDYRVLVKRTYTSGGKTMSEWVEVPKEKWLNKSQRIFAGETGFKKPSNWKVLSPAEKQRLYQDHFESYSQRGTDRADIEASPDYTDQKRLANGATVNIRPNILNVKEGKALLKDPDTLGRMYSEKVNAEIRRGNGAEALAQAAKGAKSILAVRDGYAKQGMSLPPMGKNKNVAKNLEKALDFISKQKGDSTTDPKAVESQLHALGFKGGLGEVMNRVEAQFVGLKNSKKME